MRAAVCLFGTIGGTKGKSGDKIGSKADVLNKAHPYYRSHIKGKEFDKEDWLPYNSSLSIYSILSDAIGCMYLLSIGCLDFNFSSIILALW